MEKNCRNCKWFNKGNCNNGEMVSSFSVDTKQGYQYSEEGHLSMALEENLDVKKIVGNIFNTLSEEGFVKKSYLKKQLSSESMDAIQQELIEMIDSALYTSLENYFDGGCKEMEINEPRDFRCIYWE